MCEHAVQGQTSTRIMIAPFTNFEDMENDGAPLSSLADNGKKRKASKADNGKKRKASSDNSNSTPKAIKVSDAKFVAVIESAHAENEKKGNENVGDGKA